MKLFDSVKMMAPKHNKFDLSHERKMSFNMGDLIPMFCEEVLPGDRFRVNTEIMMRLAPMLAPIMHRVNVKTEFFFVPTRLIWNEFEDFITGGRLGTSAPVAPYFNFTMFDPAVYYIPGTLLDYFGLPVKTGLVAGTDDPNFSSLPLRAYTMIWNEYYRDQNLSPEIALYLGSGNETAPNVETNLLQIRKRAWEKDYLTSCLPFAQRGATVNMPITDDPTKPTTVYRAGAGGAKYTVVGDLTHNNVSFADSTAAGEAGTTHIGADGHGIDVNALRRSVRLQEFLERMARVGSRYTEMLRGFFGVRPDDARLQRPEFLGGATTPIQISEVLSTVQQVDPTTGDPVGSPQGDMTGRGISYGRQNGFTKFFTEHGYVIGVVSVIPKTTYQQGYHRMWRRFDKLDYYWEQFANIGEQAVVNGEAYYDPDAAADTSQGTFGYQSRYAEYKYRCSSVHGDFRDTLAFWHMGRIFASAPSLNANFITSDPTHRIFAVDDPTVHKLWCQMYHRVDALRPMPYYGTPTL